MKSKISVWGKIYKLVWKFSPCRLIYLSFLGLIQAASVILQLIVIQSFVNNTQNALNSGNLTNNTSILIDLLIIGIVLIFRRLYNSYFNYNINKHIIWAKDIIKLNFIQKTSYIPLNEFYKSNFETKKNMALQGAQSASLFLIIGLMLLSFNIPYFVFIGFYYSFLSPVMLLILILIIFPSFYAISKNMQEYKELENSIANNRKKSEYYYNCIGDINYIKETKTLKAGNYFFNKIKEETNEYRTSIFKHIELILKNSLIGELIKFLGYVLIFFILIILANTNAISVGLLIATISSLNDMYSVFNDMVDRDFKSLSSFYYEVINYSDFFTEDFSSVEIKENNTKNIILNDVSYCYPNSKEYAIKNFNFEFISGKTYAIVGENGAGKTTLSRLILGLLPPSTGSLTIPIYSSVEKDSNTFSALLQNHSKYPFSLRDNVILSNTVSSPSDTKVVSSLEKCGIDISDKTLFPNSLDTVLSQEFNGIDLSGGQWQRISLARCIYKDYNILLLDEPTSAIDPINESSLFHTFEEISQEKTSIIITHRLGVVSIADYILVLDNGKLVESGTHQELIDKNGKYKQMYLTQSRNYFE